MRNGKDEKSVLNDIKTLFEYLKTKRRPHESEWSDVVTYVGSKTFSWVESSTDDIKRPKRHTGRPAEYLNTLTAGIMGYTISPNITWLKLSLNNTELLEYSGVKDWLELSEKALYDEFNRNNLYSEVPSFISNAAQFGHSVMLIDEYDKGVRFMTLPVSEIYIGENEYNDIDTVFRCFSMSIKNLINRFGKENLSENILMSADDVQGQHQEVKILHAVFPRKDFEAEKLDNKNMAYASYYIDLDNNKIVEESGYHELPFSVLIWEKIPCSAYGDSPARKAIPDMRLLNKAEEARLKLAQLAAEPPMNVPDYMRGVESVVPAGFNYYEEPSEIMMPINIGANFPITLETVKDLEARVKDKFNVDFMIMMQSQSLQKTATEVIELQGEKAAMLTSLIVNQNKALAEIVKRTFNIMFRQGKIPELPTILQNSKTGLNVDFVGPLAQAQKKYHQAGGVQMSLMLAQPVIQFSPETIDYIDSDKLLKCILETNGFPQAALREDDEVDTLRQQRAEAQAQALQVQMQMNQQQNLIGNYDKLNEPVKQGSPIGELSKQLQAGLVDEAEDYEE